MGALVCSRLLPLVEFLINVLIWGGGELGAGVSFFSSCGSLLRFICRDDPHIWLDGALWHLINSGLAQFQRSLTAAIRRGVDQIAEEACHEIVTLD